MEGGALTVEVMALDARGRPHGTGEFETIEADALILALGPGHRHELSEGRGRRRDDRRRQRRSSMPAMMTGRPGLFAGGDMVPAERSVTYAVGHGSTGRHAHRRVAAAAGVRGGAQPAADRHLRQAAPLVLHRRRASAAAARSALDARRPHSARSSPGYTEQEASGRRRAASRAAPASSATAATRPVRRTPIIKLGPGKRYAFDYAQLHGLRHLLRAVPVPRHLDGARARGPRESRHVLVSVPRLPRPGHRRRQRGLRQRRVPPQRGVRDLSDHAVVDDGGTGRSVVRRAPPEHLGRRADRHRDAERGRRGRRRPRLAAGRRADDDLHGVAGPAADDPEHVQDRRRTDAGGLPCGGAGARLARAVDLRRPPGRDGRARPPASRCWRRPRCRKPTTWPPSRRWPRSSRACRSCTSSTASAPRTRSTRIQMLSDDDLRALVDDRLVTAHRVASAQPGPSVHPRHGAEPRRLLPDARGRQRHLRARAGRGRRRDGALRGAHGPAATAWSSTRARPMPSA